MSLSTSVLSEKIRKKLQEALKPEFLEVLDESFQHAGHKGFSPDGSHFCIRIRAAELALFNRVQYYLSQLRNIF